MGPLLLSRLMELTEPQEGVLNIAFRIADEEGMALLDLKDLQAMLVWIGQNASDIGLRYGNVSPATVGAIQRQLLVLENQGGIALWRTCPGTGRHDAHGPGRARADQRAGRGQADGQRRSSMPRSCCGSCPSFSKTCPRSAIPTNRKFVFFFDEAHLLFEDAPKALVDQGRTGRPPDPVKGRGGLFHHPESGRHSR
jgi:hypothetical protein